MGEAEPVLLDRWELQVEKNPDAPPSGDDSGSHHPSRDTLPLSVVNNYFSFGVDAQIALDFHEARGKANSWKRIYSNISFFQIFKMVQQICR